MRYSVFIRLISFLFLFLATGSSIILTIIEGFNTSHSQISQWFGSLVFSIIANLILLPVLKAFFAAMVYKCCGYNITKKLIFTCFRDENSPKNQKVSPKASDQKSKKFAKIRSKQREEFRETIFHVGIYLLHVISLFYISAKILPEQKFFNDLNFRQNIKWDRGEKFHIKDVWTLVEQDLMAFIHLNRSKGKIIVSNLSQNFPVCFFSLFADGNFPL